MWGRYDQLRRDALWRNADEILKSRALARVAMILAWIALAALAVPGAAWLAGIPALLCSGLSLMHAAQATVVRLEERLPRVVSRVLERLFVYPDHPHLNWVGVVELAGLVSLGMATGWGQVLAADPAAAAVGSGLTVGVFGSYCANLTGHLAWEIDRGPAWMYRVRPFIGPFAAAIAIAVLWPASPEVAPRFVAVAGPLLVVAGCWRLAAQVGRQARDFDAALTQTREVVHHVDSLLVHSTLKNPARSIIDDLLRIADNDLRDRVQHLCYRIGGFQQSLRRGNTVGVGSAAEVVAGLLAFDETWSSRYSDSVLEDLDAGDLTKRDMAIIFIAVSDLVTNAAKRAATTLEVRLNAAPADHGSTLRLRVLCRCGTTLDRIGPTSSLMSLARLLHGENGTMMLTDAGDGSHAFDLSWPSTARPGVRALLVREPIDA